VYRLVTRSDFDGLVCGMLLKQLGIIDEIAFVHPKDVQDGLVEITSNDITTNVPWSSDAHLVFDHHASEVARVGGPHENHIIDPAAPSAARVVYDYFGGAGKFPGTDEEMMRAVDQADSAAYSLEEVLDPQNWVLLNFLMDPRTGLGRFRTFSISNQQLMLKLIDYCQWHSVSEVLTLPDVAERVVAFREQEPLFRAQLERCTVVRGNVAVLDLRDEDPIWTGNRFMIYALHPEVNVSIHVLWGKQKQNTVLAVGKSIFNRSNPVDIGTLLLETWNGGGHQNAGTCQVPHDQSEVALTNLVAALDVTRAVSV
jgi:nanoRNase/pAp phosphatase (c-di-AMP/oligoRNAs hydrolase)